MKYAIGKSVPQKTEATTASQIWALVPEQRHQDAGHDHEGPDALGPAALGPVEQFAQAQAVDGHQHGRSARHHAQDA